MSSCDRINLSVTGNDFLQCKTHSCDTKFLICNRKFFPVTVIFLLFSFLPNTAKFSASNCGNFCKDFVWDPKISWDPESPWKSHPGPSWGYSGGIVFGICTKNFKWKLAWFKQRCHKWTIFEFNLWFFIGEATTSGALFFFWIVYCSKENCWKMYKTS